MTTYSANEIAGLIYWVGGWGPNTKKPVDEAGKGRVIAWLDTAIAVCLAESSGNSEATNGTGNAAVYGLWQIKNSAHVAIVAAACVRYGTTTIRHPLANTAAARDVYKEAGNKWTPWTAYTSGAYKSHKGHGAAAYAFLHDKTQMNAFRAKLIAAGYDVSISQADIAGSNSTIIGPDLVQSNLSEQADKVNSAIDRALNALKESGMTVGVFLLGVVLLVLGVVFIVQRSGAAKKVPGPIGLVASAVKK